MYTIDKEDILTAELLQKYINDFVMSKQPKLKKWQNYYLGKQNILSKSYTDESKPCNKIVTNFCKVIVDTYLGYIVGKPVSYTSNNDIEDVQDILNYNDCATEDNEWLRNALIFSTSYEIHYLDENSMERFAQVNPVNAFAIYGNTLDRELRYFIRWYSVDSIDIGSNSDYICEVYSDTSITRYIMHGVMGSIEYIEEVPHYYHQVPVSVLQLNTDETNIFDCIISLQDAYNDLQSSELDDYQAFVDAYLVLSNMDADTEDIATMKENRVLIIPEGGQANYLTKSVNDAQLQNMLDNLKKNIFKVSSAPDMADENFLAQSGTALAYKLVGFENSASNIVMNMTKAIQRRIELICEILNIKATEAVWRDIQINFTRNLPTNITETIQLVNNLQGIVSNKTLLSQIPFIKDINAEVEAVKEQKQENMELYSFSNNSEGDTE